MGSAEELETSEEEPETPVEGSEGSGQDRAALVIREKGPSRLCPCLPGID
jgi:hypothetical protein